MMIARDIVLVGDNLEEVNNRLNKWRLGLEGKRLRMRGRKTECMSLEERIKMLTG